MLIEKKNWEIYTNKINKKVNMTIRRKILRMKDLEKKILGKINQRILDKFKIDVTRIHLFTIDIYFRKF
jgi:hypothetical protein